MVKANHALSNSALDVSGNFRLSLSHFALFLQRVDGSNLQVAGFLAGCRHLMRTLNLVQHQFLRCNSLLGVHLWDQCPKSRADHESQKSGLNLNPRRVLIL